MDEDWREDAKGIYFRVKTNEKARLTIIAKPVKSLNSYQRPCWDFPVRGIEIDGQMRPCDKTWRVTSRQLLSQLAQIPYDWEMATVDVACFGEKTNTTYSVIITKAVIPTVQKVIA